MLNETMVTSEMQAGTPMKEKVRPEWVAKAPSLGIRLRQTTGTATLEYANQNATYVCTSF